MRPQNIGQTGETRLISQTREMHIHSETHRILGSRTGREHDPDGSDQDQRSRRMATTEKSHRHSLIPRLHRVLLLLYPQLLARCTTPTRLDKESDTMDLDRGPNES